MNYKIEMTLFFTDYQPRDGAPLNLVEEADAIKITPPIEISEKERDEALDYPPAAP